MKPSVASSSAYAPPKTSPRYTRQPPIEPCISVSQKMPVCRPFRLQCSGLNCSTVVVVCSAIHHKALCPGKSSSKCSHSSISLAMSLAQVDERSSSVPAPASDQLEALDERSDRPLALEDAAELPPAELPRAFLPDAVCGLDTEDSVVSTALRRLRRRARRSSAEAVPADIDLLPLPSFVDLEPDLLLPLLFTSFARASRSLLLFRSELLLRLPVQRIPAQFVHLVCLHAEHAALFEPLLQRLTRPAPSGCASAPPCRTPLPARPYPFLLPLRAGSCAQSIRPPLELRATA